jgi:hypothetical protein
MTPPAGACGCRNPARFMIFPQLDQPAAARAGSALPAISRRGSGT